MFSYDSKEFLRLAWVVAFAILTFGLFEQASSTLTRSIQKLETRATRLQEAITEAEELQLELKLQIASQSDPAWIELCLMKGLGLVPEEYQKIYFEEGK